MKRRHYDWRMGAIIALAFSASALAEDTAPAVSATSTEQAAPAVAEPTAAPASTAEPEPATVAQEPVATPESAPAAVAQEPAVATESAAPSESVTTETVTTQITPPPVAVEKSAPVAASEPVPETAAVEQGPAQVRFLVMADKESPLSSVVAGRVMQVNVQLGDNVAAGKLLATLDCSELKARKDAAEAEFSAAQIKYEAKAKLQGLDSAGALEVGLAAADVNRTRSQIKIFDAQLAQCRFTAPFEGRIARIYVKEGQGIGAGAPVIDLVGNGNRKARLNVPSSWMNWLTTGARFDAVVGENGQHYQMTVSHISGRVDAVSQTIEIETLFVDNVKEILPGMSGRATPVCPQDMPTCASGANRS